MLPALLNFTLGLLLVLVLRVPARRWFGAGPAFSLWLLPCVLASLPWLPTLPSAWTTIAPLQVSPGSISLVARPEMIATRIPSALACWGAGAAAGILRILLQYGQILRDSRRPPKALVEGLQKVCSAIDSTRLLVHPAGPAVLWSTRSLILLPADFLERYEAAQQRLVLQHESTHLRRGDPLWRLLAEICTALLWFHPLVWLAIPRLRLDMELACDEHVLRHSPDDESCYAHTLLQTTAGNTPAALIPWLQPAQLKERLQMIQRHRPGNARRRIGTAALCVLMASSALALQATTPDRPASSDLSFNIKLQPHYPQDAVKNMQEGTVVLMVLVGTDGTPLKVEVDPKTKAVPSLVKAASEAAMQWHFNPAMKDGKPIEGYVRVPVQFSLDPLPASPDTPMNPQHSSSTNS